jgi:hypothetical protein
MSFQDPSGVLNNIMRSRVVDAQGDSSLGTQGPGTFDERATVGETPLFITRPDEIDAPLDPSKTDVWGYSYRSVQRPLITGS